MKINVVVDLEDFIGGWGHDLEAMLKESINDEVVTKFKRTPEYKAHVKQQLDKLVGGLS